MEKRGQRVCEREGGGEGIVHWDVQSERGGGGGGRTRVRERGRVEEMG